VSKGTHPHSTCRDAVHFDVWSHHPYTTGGPFGRAKIRDDVMLGDLPRMRALLRAGVRLHHLVSSHPVKFWVTEFGWDTRPPRPNAAPLGLAARWTAESLHQMWLSGVSLVTWYLLQDYPSPSPYQSGFYFNSDSLADARPKPSLTAFRFPFVAYLRKSASASGDGWRRVTSGPSASSFAMASTALADGRVDPVQSVRHLQGEAADPSRERTRSRNRPGLAHVARVLAHAAEGRPRIGPWGY
jgi:hypothetical protein